MLIAHYGEILIVITRRRLIENFLLSTGAHLLNTNERTYFNFSHQTYSSIDLSITSSTLVLYLEWRVIKNLYGSDHLLIVKSLRNQNSCSPQILRWKIKSVNWELFQQHSFLKWDHIACFSIDNALAYTTQFINDPAEKSIKHTNGQVKNVAYPGGIRNVEM